MPLPIAIRLDIELARLAAALARINPFTMAGTSESVVLEARVSAGPSVVMSAAEIPELAKDKAKLKTLMKTYIFFAQPSLMMQVGKNLGQVMGTKDKLPKPIIGGSLDKLAEAERRTVKLKSKGKYLPTVSCLVGNENMEAEKIVENINQVYEAVSNSVGKQSLKSGYIKLTMGKPVKVF